MTSGDGGASPRLEPTSAAGSRRRLALALDSGWLPQVLVDSWTSIEALAAEDEAGLADLLAQGAALGPDRISSLAYDADLLALALIAPPNRVLHADPEVRALLGEPPAELRRLTRLRGTRGTVHLVQSDVGPTPVLAAPFEVLKSWPLLKDRLPERAPGAVALLVHRAGAMSARLVKVAKACGLTNVEALLLEALAYAPDLEAASTMVGLGRESGKDVLARATRRLKVTTAPQALGQILALAVDLAGAPTSDAVQKGLGLSPAEARVAARLAAGDTAAEVASRLGLSPSTVKTYRRAIFDKTGANRARHLGRLLFEVAALDRLSRHNEVSPRPRAEPTRALFADDGRRVVFLDYGPPGAEVVVLAHGYLTGRLAPPPLLGALQERGFRVVVPQRPGFGLTDPSARLERYLSDAADDLARILDRLGVQTCRLLARDGVTAALAFAERYPDRLQPSVLLNPRAPKTVVRRSSGPNVAISRLLLNHPRLIDDFGRMIMRHSRSDFGRSNLIRYYSHFPRDRAAIADPGVVDHLLQDLGGVLGTSTQGFQMELRLHAEGWAPPDISKAVSWTLAFSSEGEVCSEAWRDLNIARDVVIPGGGLLTPFTDSELLADLVRNAPQKGGAGQSPP